MRKYQGVFLMLLLSSIAAGTTLEQVYVQLIAQATPSEKRKRLLERSFRKWIKHIRTIQDMVYAVEHRKQAKSILDKPSIEGMTPLQAALEYDDAPLIKQVLAAGANPNYGYTTLPLEKAKRLSHITCLLQAGAEPKLCTQSPLIKPLSHYLERYHKEDKEQELMRKAVTCLLALLKAGANPNQPYVFKEGYRTIKVTPIKKILDLVAAGYVAESQAKDLLKPLILYGAAIEEYGHFTELSAQERERNSLIAFMREVQKQLKALPKAKL
jgi:hypothetical protein